MVTQSISSHLKCSMEDAEQIKLSGNVDESILREGSHALASKLNNEIIISLNYSQNLLGTQEQVERILVTGGASSTPFLIPELISFLNVEIQPLAPTRKIELHPHMDPSHMEEISTRIPVAMGTALRSVLF